MNIISNKTIIIMRKITVGRNPDNNIVITDSRVSRYHCEIIQKANQIKLVDLNSVNGTFVNGKRVCGAICLNYGDSVSVCNVPIRWQDYLTDNKVEGRLEHQRGIHLIIAVAGATIASIAIAIAMFVLIKYKIPTDDIYFDGEYPQVGNVYYSDNGKDYYFEAFQGQVIVYFDENTSYQRAKRAIEANGGEILSQIIDAHYFLVQVGEGAENTFIKNMELESGVEYIFLHMPEYPCAVSAHILDSTQTPNEYGDIHGQLVAATAMSACDDCVFAKEYNIADQNGDIVTNKATEYIKTIFAANQDSPILINMSYGIYLTDAQGKKIKYKKLLKDDSQNQQQLIDSWVKQYIKSLRNIILAVKPYKDRDFVITKSAGNSGCHEFDKIILKALEEELTPEERNIMDDHILLVSAYDEVVRVEKEDGSLRNYKHSESDSSWWEASGIYANRPKNYHHWVTTTDISHLARRDGLTLDGTSFAAPNALGNIARIIDKYNITAKEALQVVKKVTKENALKYGGAGILDVVALDKEAEKSASIQLKEIINPPREPKQFAGVWIDDMQTIKLDLDQSGNQLTGCYSTTSHGGDLDDPLCVQYITGSISGDAATFSYDYYSEESYRDEKKRVTVTLKLLSDTKMELTTAGGHHLTYMYRQMEHDIPSTLVEGSPMKETTFYIRGDDKPLELPDGTRLYARLWTVGLGDLTLDISRSATTPIKVAWQFDGFGMEPTSNVIYPTMKSGTRFYDIDERVFFKWTDKNPVIKGVYITVSPLTEEEKRKYVKMRTY